MRLQLFRIGVVGAALVAPCAAWTQQATTRTVVIQVSDPSGSPIAHAQIKLWPAPEPVPAKMETDDNGALSLNLKAGSYALRVSEQGFKNWAETIYVAKPEGKSNASQVCPVVLQVGAYSGPTAVYPEDSLVLNGGAYHGPVALSPAEFRALPHITITVHNSHSNADERYSGVLLATLLAMVNAPMGKEVQKEELTSYLIASGSDGYSVLLALAEADPSFHVGQVLVADARDGQPLGKSGPYKLIVSEDKRPGRWVHNLNFIELQGPR